MLHLNSAHWVECSICHKKTEISHPGAIPDKCPGCWDGDLKLYSLNHSDGHPVKLVRIRGGKAT